MKYVWYTVAIVVFSLAMVFVSAAARSDLRWVRAQYAGAVRCYAVGQEPKNILVKNKRYFSSFEECDLTIGHAL